MSTAEVACPYCGIETLATVSEGTEDIRVTEKPQTSFEGYTYSSVGCPNGHQFAVGHK